MTDTNIANSGASLGPVSPYKYGFVDHLTITSSRGYHSFPSWARAC